MKAPPKRNIQWVLPQPLTFSHKGQLYQCPNIIDNRFKINNHIDQGGSGAIFDALDITDNKHVVVKIVSSQL